MIKDKGTSIKVSNKFQDLIDNVRTTRRSKVMATDTDLLTKQGTCDLIVKYFKLNNDRFLELIKLPVKENV